MNKHTQLNQINKLAAHFNNLSDLELQAQTEKLKARIQKGEKENKLIVEAFATMREACRRVLGLFPTDEQVLGGLVLAKGAIAEIKTGEGKSLVATLPLYLKALMLDHAFLVTTNDYLARRDYERIGKVYEWLGLSVADGTNEPDDSDKEPDVILKRKKAIYKANIIYISNGTLGFDFLIDGLAENAKARFICPFRFALLDEVDEILLDSAQQPLIISGGPKVQSNYFHVANAFVQLLKKDQHYTLIPEEDQVWLTEEGVAYAKHYFSTEDLLAKRFFTLYQHLILALKAHHTLKRDRDYLIEDGEIKLLDRKDGRILEGTNLQSGLHQAVEAKEDVKLSLESQTITSITFQNLFRSFSQLAGMSGTAKSAADEFIKTYNLSVKRIKTHKKNQRIDHPPIQYHTFEDKIHAALTTIEQLYQAKRPLLIIASSVETSELFSLQLFYRGIPHNVLNAKSSVKEAQIIQEAGQIGSVTVATAMAGRGTDIKLSPQAIENGGLAVVLTERMTNQRVELQAKGRAGRQGEPGDTYAFESLEDELIQRFLQERIQTYYDRHQDKKGPIKRRKIKRSFSQAQRIAEDQAFMQRVKALQFDEVLKLQKKAVDQSRTRLLNLTGVQDALELVKHNVQSILKDYFTQEGNQSIHAFERFILDNIDYNFKPTPLTRALETPKEKQEFILQHLTTQFKKKQAQLHDDPVFLQFLQAAMLKAVDMTWSEQVDALNQLRFVVQHRTIAQKNPLLEFEQEAKKNYKNVRERLARRLVTHACLSLLEIKKGKVIITFP